MLTVPVRLLGDTDRAEVHRLLDAEPIAAAQVAERVEAGGLTWWRTGARVFGYGPPGRLESLCWLGANLIPVRAGTDAIAGFAELARREGRRCSSIVGESAAVLQLWERLAPHWSPAREIRSCQPLLMTADRAPVAPDPDVRLVRANEVGTLFPASVAMYTEEVGVSPIAEAGGRVYRQRVAELVRSRRAYARFVDGRVVFKAELAVVTRHTAQVQGVWVAPEWRGRGLGTAGMAAVVADALERVAPTVSLYVNDYNTSARRVYERCGFRAVGAFATVLF
ncbi:GNAT family N-acetyltransferase [Actinocatenispora sera]|uniref:GNAT family N-acetyltransferase n=1 Tax=Actinocatenispora sera TaxID=390989 RepID=UPI003405E3FE